MTRAECKKCGNGFVPMRDWQVFCCTKCRKDFNNREARRVMHSIRERLLTNGDAPHLNGGGGAEVEEPKVEIKKRKFADAPAEARSE